MLILVIFAVWQTEIQGLVARLANAVRSCATKRPSMLTTSSVHHVKKEDEEQEEDTADVGAVARQKTRTKDTPACASITIAEHEVVVTEQAGRVDIVVRRHPRSSTRAHLSTPGCSRAYFSFFMLLAMVL